MEYVCALRMTQAACRCKLYKVMEDLAWFPVLPKIFISQYVELILLSFLILLNEFEEPIKKSCKILHAQFEAFWLAECTAFVMHS